MGEVLRVLMDVFQYCSALELLLLWPLQLYERSVIWPVGVLRRRWPVVGGALVLLMTLHGMFCRYLIQLLQTFLQQTLHFSADPHKNFQHFWTEFADRYAYFGLRAVDWNFVQHMFGDKMSRSTSDEDLWNTLVNSIAMFEDPSVTVYCHRFLACGTKRKVSFSTAVSSLMNKHDHINLLRETYLTDGGGKVGNNFTFGLLNAETSPGWRIGYISISAMDKFVELPIPKIDFLGSSSSTSKSAYSKASLSNLKKKNDSGLVVPEIYVLESMKWALEAILLSFGYLDGLILDIRYNDGGGSLLSSLNIASFFVGPKKLHAFSIEERLPSPTYSRFSKRKNYFIPKHQKQPYLGPLVILQGGLTSGSAELLSVSLQQRPDTYRIGSRTAGSLSEVYKFTLPNGWEVELPYQRCYSHDNQLYEMVGVPVDKYIDTSVSSNKPLINDECIKKAVEHFMHV